MTPALKYKTLQSYGAATGAKRLVPDGAGAGAEQVASTGTPLLDDEYAFLVDPSAVPALVPVEAGQDKPIARPLVAQGGDHAPDAVVHVPGRSGLPYRWQVLQQWECVIREVNGDEFTAVLYDLTNRSAPEEEATFSCEDVADSDKAFVVAGATFYWSLGYRSGIEGQKERSSQLRFRRLPPPSRAERREIEAEARAFGELLRNDD